VSSSTLLIIVRDTGHGIPDHALERIFDPFFTTKPVGQGTGLGLSISYRIIQEHAGDIRAHQEPDRGTSFIISLPADLKSALSIFRSEQESLLSHSSR
jgi:signal transduction histidine kinase